MISEDRATPDVTSQRHDLGEDRAVQENRIAAEALIHGDNDLGVGLTVPIHQQSERAWLDERLVRQNDEGGVYFGRQSGDSRSKRGPHSLSIGIVDYDVEVLRVNALPYCFGGMAQDENDITDTGRANILEHVFEQRVLTQPKKLLCSPHS